MLPINHCQFLPPLCPLQAETVVVGSQQGLPWVSIGTVTMGQERLSMFFRQSSFHINFSSAPPKLEYLWSDPVRPSSTKHALDEAWLSGEPVDLPGTKFPMAACLWNLRLTVAWVKPTWPATALCHMPSRAIASILLLLPIGVGQSIIRTVSENWGKKDAVVDSNLSECEVIFGRMVT